MSGIFFRHFLTHLFQILDLDAEMIETCLAAAAARNECHADIAVADRNGANFARCVAGHLEPEHGAIEHAKERVVIAGDGEMIEFAEHAFSCGVGGVQLTRCARPGITMRSGVMVPLMSPKAFMALITFCRRDRETSLLGAK